MVPFAGYELPVQYDGLGVMKEHHQTRESAAIFDVSHMGQIRWTGKDHVAFLERVLVGDISSLDSGKAMLSLITSEQGTILDDTIVTHYGDHTFMVVNGACKHTDIAHFKQQMDEFDGDVHMEHLEGRSLVALQGPKAAEVLAQHVGEDLSKLEFMNGIASTSVAGIAGCSVVRCGYTGEDGFEIGFEHADAEAVVSALLADERTDVAGLGCRDSLRLEAGLCLYGNDLDETITPNEASLMWTISKRRRAEGGFLGAEVVQGQLKDGVTRRRVGIAGMKAPARAGTKIFSADGSEEIGVVTSGTFSPTLKKPLAMGYVKKGHTKSGTDINVEVRGKMQSAQVSKMPFTPYGYYKL